METKTKQTNILGLSLLVLSLVTIGIVGYMVIEGWNFLDALYMVVITLATIGFKEIHPLSPAGVVFTILFVIFGLFVLTYAVRILSEYVLENKLEEALRNRTMEKTLHSMEKHFIICGFGRVGKEVVSELADEGAKFVVIEKDPTLAAECEALGHLCIHGDSSDEAVLKKASIASAKSLISCLGEDSDTVLTIVTAKSLNNELFIVARANGENTAPKLLKIGANRVVSPHQIGGFRMASFGLNPTVADFIDDLQDIAHREIQISDIIVPNTSPIAGHTIAAKLSNRNFGVTVLAINKPEGNAIINPIGDTLVEAGDRLILLGTKDKIDNIVQLIGSKTR